MLFRDLQKILTSRCTRQFTRCPNCHARKLRAPRGVKQLAAESAAMKVLPVTSFIES